MNGAADGREELPPGAFVADRFEIGERISAGAMGAVYRARDGDGEEVALKRLIQEGQRERFEIEGRLLARLSHPRVVEVRGHVRDDSGDYLVMDLVRGVDLAMLVAERGGPGCPSTRRSSMPGRRARRSSTCTISRSSTVTSSHRT